MQSQTALHYAVMSNQRKAVSALLSGGANPSAINCQVPFCCSLALTGRGIASSTPARVQYTLQLSCSHLQMFSSSAGTSIPTSLLSHAESAQQSVAYVFPFGHYTCSTVGYGLSVCIPQHDYDDLAGIHTAHASNMQW